MIDSENPKVLAPEKQDIIRGFVGQLERMTRGEVKLPKVAETFDIGAVVPNTIELFALPHDIVGEVPQITSYRFFIALNGIVVVDPESRQVVQIVRAP